MVAMADDDPIRRRLVDLAFASARRAIAQSPQVKFRPGTIPGGMDPANPARAISVLLDGDALPVVAQSIVGEVLHPGQRVMCAFTPPHGCFVIGIIDHWPTERGLLVAGEFTATGGPKSTTSAAYVDFGLTLDAFVGPASGRVRVTYAGLMTSGATGCFLRMNDTVAASPVANTDRYTLGFNNPLNYTTIDNMIATVSPGEEYIWELQWGVDVPGNAFTIYNGGVYGPMRVEVWAMPPEETG